jgi:hypothetical protein
MPDENQDEKETAAAFPNSHIPGNTGQAASALGRSHGALDRDLREHPNGETELKKQEEESKD